AYRGLQMSDDTPALPAIRIEALSATRARNDEKLAASWLDSLRSAHSQRNFAMTAQRFLAALPKGLRAATVEDVRDAIVAATLGASTATARQYTLRIKSLLSYGHELGYMTDPRRALEARAPHRNPLPKTESRIGHAAPESVRWALISVIHNSSKHASTVNAL